MKVNTSQVLKIIFSWLGKIYWLVIIIWLLNSCSYGTPPKELAPTGEIVKQAIALQLQQTEQALAQKLNLAAPEIKISKIRVKQLQPIFVDHLPTYHLQGKYHLKLKLSRRQIEQKNNAFDVYLQRQAEGKTWRLLRKEFNENNESQWSSYLIHN